LKNWKKWNVRKNKIFFKNSIAFCQHVPFLLTPPTTNSNWKQSNSFITKSVTTNSQLWVAFYIVCLVLVKLVRPFPWYTKPNPGYNKQTKRFLISYYAQYTLIQRLLKMEKIGLYLFFIILTFHIYRMGSGFKPNFSIF
jgi:hypothetical protein